MMNAPETARRKCTWLIQLSRSHRWPPCDTRTALVDGDGHPTCSFHGGNGVNDYTNPHIVPLTASEEPNNQGES
jgi:hypothetical protein